MAPQGVAFPVEGGCDCGELRYSLLTAPMIVHCCHCRWCQRETGASFALHAMIETERLKLLKGKPEWNTVPSATGVGQRIARCPTCKVTVWSVYNFLEDLSSAKDRLRIVDVGTLDYPDPFGPDVHIWTSTKQPWVILSDKTPAYLDANYVDEEVWTKESLERRRRARAVAEAE